MKAYRIYSVYEEIGKTQKGRSKKGYVEKKDEIRLDSLVKFSNFDILNLKQLGKDLEELGCAVSAILLSDPDKYRDYFQRRVEAINEDNKFTGYQGEEVVLE